MTPRVDKLILGNITTETKENAVNYSIYVTVQAIAATSNKHIFRNKKK